MLLLQESMMETMADHMDTTSKDQMCADLISEVDTELLDSMINHGIDCLDTLERHEEVSH